MSLNHSIALLAIIVFLLIAITARKTLWWVMVFLSDLITGWVASVNQWEVLFFIPLIIIGIASCVAMIKTASEGELI